jgi:hypothetical protein
MDLRSTCSLQLRGEYNSRHVASLLAILLHSGLGVLLSHAVSHCGPCLQVVWLTLGVSPCRPFTLLHWSLSRCRNTLSAAMSLRSPFQAPLTHSCSGSCFRRYFSPSRIHQTVMTIVGERYWNPFTRALLTGISRQRLYVHYLIMLNIMMHNFLHLST